MSRLSSTGPPLAALVEPASRAARGRCARPRMRVVLVVHQPELERGRGAEDAQRLVRILHAGQLHGDAVDALARHDRLGHAELVDAVAQRGDVLLDREVLALLDLRRASARRVDRAALAERVGRRA